MAAMRGPRLQVGSAAWVAEERSSALQIAQAEVEEFAYSARNELDWLNEHMAGIFDENEVNIAETFKTPGKLRGKTPRTARKTPLGQARVPLSDVFQATPVASGNTISQKINRLQSPKAVNRPLKASPSPAKAPTPRQNVFAPKSNSQAQSTQDSGYYGSQDIGAVNIHTDLDVNDDSIFSVDDEATLATNVAPVQQSVSRAFTNNPPEKSFQIARDDEVHALTDITTNTMSCAMSEKSESNVDQNRVSASIEQAASATAPRAVHIHDESLSNEKDVKDEDMDENEASDSPSQSDNSSPIRAVVRKSSLNFAPLPAREPLTAGKSMGGRASRVSQLDQTRTSYYQRPTGGKSLGNLATLDDAEDDNQDDMQIDHTVPSEDGIQSENLALNHTKTYTQRLQDQINMLGKSQNNNGQSKLTFKAEPQHNEQPAQVPSTTPRPTSSTTKDTMQNTPGAFPEDDEDDDWIEPPTVTKEFTESRPALPKSHSADVMEDIQGKGTIGQPGFGRTILAQGSGSPSRLGTGHGKSASVSVVPSSVGDLQVALSKQVSASNPNLLAVSEADDSLSPLKSPSRSFRENPLKQVKNKLSSILKGSRGLLASSAAISAEGKSMLSPSSTKLGFYLNGSSDSILSKAKLASQISLVSDVSASPSRPRRTRASAEREKDEKRREKESKHMEQQMDKLEKAREKEREKARVFSKEQEKTAYLEKQVASKAEEEKTAIKELPRPTRSSPRKAKVPADEEATLAKDVEMTDVPSLMPPSTSRAAGPSQTTRTKDVKRPVRPTKETAKSKQAPTVIRVNTGSQHSQYQPSANRQSTNASERIALPTAQPQQQLSSKVSKASLQTKSSIQSLKGGAPSSAARSKAQEMNARKKEQEEREAQRRRDAKAETERKRVAAQEEQRKQEQQRRQEAEAQKQKEREQAEEKKAAAQRQAAIERAKQTRAPPPAVRSRPNGPPDLAVDSQPPRPPSRMQPAIQRSNDDANRPVNALLSNASKAGAKRTLPPTSNDEAKRPQSRAGPAYQAKDAKRRRTSEQLGDELGTVNPPNIKGPPVRPSAGFKKDGRSNSVFQSGYSNAPPSVARDLFKATVTAQHTGQAKATHPLDMAQISKGAIPFAPNTNPVGSAYKTPARPGQFGGAKSAAKSVPRTSPRFQNGDAIELPEIQTDDESDEDDAAQGMPVAAWADSPDLRRALMLQETMDPSNIFGPPAPLNMEEVFNKSKEKFAKFRARTSSANWSGADRLTEDDIRKDLAARDKLRREGGWSYEMSKDMI